MNMDIWNGYIRIVENIKSAVLCQRECEKELKCEMFAWSAPQHLDHPYNCFLKEDKFDRTTFTEMSDMFVGPKVCGR